MKKTIRDFDLNDKTVLIRCDFNVPIKDGKVIDNTRIVESLDTIKYAILNSKKVVLLSHLGRIKDESDKLKNTLLPVKEELEKLLYLDVTFIADFKNAKNIIDNSDSKVFLLENTRYFDFPDKLESNNDKELGKYFSSLGDIFINDAFGTCHRKHASNVGISSNLPSGIGFLIEKELSSLKRLDNPDRPYVVMLGGSKVSDKIGLIENLLNKADKIVIGGAMAFTFLKAKGYNVGKSLVEDDYLRYAKKLLTDYVDKIILPIDIKVAKEFKDVPYREVLVSNISDDDIGMDIGNLTVDLIKDVLYDAKTIMWNGPFGVYEFENYKLSTNNLIDYISNTNAFTVFGGGDIVAALSKTDKKKLISHVSTGGGATLEYLEGKVLPGIEAIEDK